MTPADLLDQVYGELRTLAASKMAREPAGHTLDATGLVNEAWLRLKAQTFTTKGDFLRAAAVAMRRILVDHARQKKAGKRGGGARTVTFEEIGAGRGPDPDLLLDVDEALARLAAEDPSSAEVARHRLFAGLSIEEAAEALGISRASAFREWAYARSWLATALARPDDGEAQRRRRSCSA